MRIVEHVALTDTGRQRRGNEDSYFEAPPLFAVADGMGGAQAGEVASHLAVECLGQGLGDGASTEERLARVAHAANARIHELSRRDRERAGMGTTLTAVRVDDDDLAVAHVGDSRLYRVRHGELERLTRDHTLVQALIDQGKLDEASAAVHPQRSVITRALGPEPAVEVDTQSVRLRDGDMFLLCSDGLTGMVDEETLGRIVSGSEGLREAGERLIDAANAAGGRDNITVVLFRVEGEGDADADEQPTGASAAVAAPPRPRAAPEARASRRQPRPAGAEVSGGARRRPRRPRLAPLVALVVILGLVLTGAWLASRQVFFVGTDDQGRVAVFRGLPISGPFGADMYETFYVSGVPLTSVPRAGRNVITDHKLRSHADASDLVDQLELGKLAAK